MSNPTANPRLRYQPALDGLRAVAVLGVMIFHAGVDRLQGGFLGVDLFFVLSGFLITTLLLREIDATGGLSFGEFYARRARRLLPALLLTILAVAFYAQFVGPLATRRSVRFDAVASLLYVANWRFIYSHQSYFDAVLEVSPLRHLWSLAIEEQWYLLWPLVLVGLMKVLRGRLGRLAGLLALAAVASWGWMAHLVGSGADPSRAYYGTDSHAFVLLAGAALAVLHHRRPEAQRRRGPARVARQVLGACSLGVILWLFLVANGNDLWTYRGGYAAFTLAAVAVTDAAMLQGRNLLGSVLGWAPLAWVGRISYGLYLVHWPVAVGLNSDRFFQWSTTQLFVARMLASFGLATASYYLLEKPIRSASWERLARPRMATAAAAGLGVAVLLVVQFVVIRPPAHDPDVPWAATAKVDTSKELATPIPVVPGDLRVLLIGDSVGLLEGVGVDTAGVTLIKAARAGCGLVPYTGKALGSVLTWNGQPGACGGVTQDWEQGLHQHPDVVVLVAGAWEVYDRRIGTQTFKVGTPQYAALITSHLEDVRRFFAARTDVPLVIQDVPCMRPGTSPEGSRSGVRSDDQRTAWVNEVFAQFQQHHPDTVSILPVSQFSCPGGTYRRDIDGVVLRPDGIHYNPRLTSKLWAWMLPRLLRTPGVEVANP